MITHQFQPTPYTCVHACIAMILGKPVQEVIDEIGYHSGMLGRECIQVLNHYDVMYAPTQESKLWHGWNMVVVPSLNIRGGAHQILVHFEKGKYRVLDPSPKIRYKEDGSDLVSWFDVILVQPRQDQTEEDDNGNLPDMPDEDE